MDFIINGDVLDDLVGVAVTDLFLSDNLFLFM